MGSRRFTLERIEEVHDLSKSASQMLSRSAFDFPGSALETLHQKVFEVPSNTIHGQDAKIVNVEVAFGMSESYLGRIDLVEPVNF